MLSWTQIVEIDCPGTECGADRYIRPELDNRPRIVARKALLENNLSHAAGSFAYPHGYQDRVVRRLVQKAGFSSAGSAKQAISSTTDDLCSLARIAISPDAPINRFVAKLEGRGVRSAPRRERPRNIAWRLVRRTATRLGRHPQLSFGPL